MDASVTAHHVSPFTWDVVDSVESAGKLAIHRTGRVGIIAEVDRRECAVHEGVRVARDDIEKVAADLFEAAT